MKTEVIIVLAICITLNILAYYWDLFHNWRIEDE